MLSARSNRQAEELRRLMQHLFRRFGALAAEATPCGMPLSMPHAHALMVLLVQRDLSQQELGRELCIDKSNVARLCARMVEAGHVTQRQSEQDGRSRRVVLTARGKRMAQQVEASSGARFRTLLGGVQPALRPLILESLRHLVAAVDALPRSVPPPERIPK